VRQSDVQWTSDRRTWCQFYVVLMLINVSRILEELWLIFFYIWPDEDNKWISFFLLLEICLHNWLHFDFALSFKFWHFEVCDKSCLSLVLWQSLVHCIILFFSLFFYCIVIVLYISFHFLQNFHFPFHFTLQWAFHCILF